MKKQSLPLDLIRIDADTQSRLTLNQDTVDDYADILRGLPANEWPFPPLDVFHDGSEYFLGDGFHRDLGAVRAERVSAPCIVHKGTAKDARIFAMTANDRHGLRLSRADKRANVVWLLENGGKITQKEIAEKSGVSERLVKMIVAERTPTSTTCPPSKVSDKGNLPFSAPIGGDDEDQPDDVVALRPKNGDKAKPEPKSITGKTGHESEVWQAQQVIKTWADAVGRWMSCHPSIDSYRNKFPGMAGDRVIEAAKELWTALDAWKKVLK